MTRRRLLPLLVAAAALSGCPGRQPLPQGPPPEYEKPVLAPWDAGQPTRASDPFAAAAQGGWVDETGGAANADAGAKPDSRSGADAAPEAAAIGR